MLAESGQAAALRGARVRRPRDERPESREPAGKCHKPDELNRQPELTIMKDLKALIVYDTITGHSRRAAEDIAEGLASEGVSPRLQSAGEMTEWDTTDLAVLAVGGPCHAGSLAIRAGLSGPIRSILRRLTAGGLADKVAGAFAVHCAYGGHRTVRAIEKRLRSVGARVIEPGVIVKAGVPFSVVRGPMASEESREQLRELGRALARAAGEGRQQAE